jgi:uncharacterized membrane protein
MLFVGGLCGILVGLINQIPLFYNARIILQSAIGVFIVLAVEFISGCILNLWLKLDIWDYTGLWGNILGQVCVLFGLLWLALMPFAIWLEDTLCWLIYLWDEKLGRDAGKPPFIPPYTLLSIYKDFITGK